MRHETTAAMWGKKNAPPHIKQRGFVASARVRSQRRAKKKEEEETFSPSSSSSSFKWLEKKTTLVFDLDGVLYPASNGYLEKVRNNQRNYLIEKHGVSEDEARKIRKEAFAKHNQTLKGLRSLGFDVDHDEFTEYVRKGMYEYLSRDERVNETLERLKKRAASASKKGKMVLMTNTAEKQARKCLDALEIDEKLFEDGIFGSSFMGDCAKPMPEAFEMVCRDIGVSPKECIMFEDSFKNLKTCVSVLGMGGVFVAGETLEMELSGKTDARTELDSVANVVVESIGDLFEVCPDMLDF